MITTLDNNLIPHTNDMIYAPLAVFMFSDLFMYLLDIFDFKEHFYVEMVGK